MERQATDWFGELVANHRVDAIRLAWRLLGSHRDMAEEIVQRAFVTAWFRRRSFRGEAAPKTWIYRIVVNEVRSHQRWAAVRRRAQSWLPYLLFKSPVGSTFPDHGLKARICEAIDALSHHQREVFVLVYLDGQTVREASEITGRAEGTVKSHLHRALRKLRTDLADLWEEDAK